MHENREFLARFNEKVEGFSNFPFKIYGISYAMLIRLLKLDYEKGVLVNANRHSQFAQDLERLYRRIQENKKTLHESKIKAQNLNASLQTANRAGESRRQQQGSHK
jgi:uncharacterized protein YlxW (UPF0749 family)